MPLSLRPWQWAALPYLEWFLDDTARQSGRSTTIAVALIRLACRHPRRVIRFWDHALSTRDTRELIGRSVRVLVEEDPQLQGRYNGNQASFWLNLPEPLLNWLPEAAPGIDPSIDRFPPPVISIPPYLIGDNVYSIRYLLETFRQSPLEELEVPSPLEEPEVPSPLEEPEVPTTSVLDRLLAGAEDP